MQSSPLSSSCVLLCKTPNQISAKFAARAIKTPRISPILAIYWGKLIYVQIWPIKVHPHHKVHPQTADYVLDTGCRYSLHCLAFLLR